MKRNSGRCTALMLAAALCAALLAAPVGASAAPGATSTGSAAIGGSTAKLVAVPMIAGRTGEISLANNSVTSAAAPATLINQKNSQANTSVVAAINGGFFDSYSGSPVAMDAIINNGKLIHTGRSATLGFTREGKPMIDWVDFTGTDIRLGNGYSVNVGKSVNKVESAPESIMLFNDHYTVPVTVPATSAVVLIQNGVVTGIGSGGTFTVSPGCDVLVYNSAAAELYKGWGQFPEVGMSAKMVLKATGTARDAAWSNVQSALTGGPVLVKDGVNVVDNANNQSFYSDQKQRPDTVLARSFVGIHANGSLVLGTVPAASFRQIANWMVANGYVEGIAMDGGGSCMLYDGGSGFLSSGRNLVAALTIVDRVGAGGLPAESNLGDPNTDIPDSWALDDINTAISLGLVPETLRKGYRDPINRADFCQLIYQVVRKHPDFINKLYTRPEVSFSDVLPESVVANVARLGLVSGSGGKFNPNGQLTRAQAAKILALTIQYFGVSDSGEQYPFSDRAAFPAWDKGWIDFCGVNKVLKGSGGAFDPNGTFSREQAILTILRIYNNYCPK